jgi:molecular chaperone GrpE (heat shock protein)
MPNEAREPAEENQEIEEETTEEETEEQEEQLEGIGESDIHPADRLLECVKEILNQEKRLQKKNIHNLKYELQNNIYPLLRVAISAIIDYIDATESEKEEAEIDEKVQEAVRKSVEIAIDNCKRLVKINEEFGEPIMELLTDELKSDYTSVVEWAKSSIEQTTAQVQ